MLSKVLTIEGWHLILTAIGVITPIILMFMGIERSRKKDINERFSKKADRKELEDINRRVDKLDLDYNQKSKELKEEFLDRINDLKSDFNTKNSELSDKFDMLLIQVINVIKEK